MRALSYLLILGLVISLSSCKVRSKPSDTINTCKVLVVTTPDVSTPIVENVSVTKILMENECLLVRVKFKGCDQSNFDLVYNGKAKKSSPPQVNLMLKSLDVNCESSEELERDFKFDIKKLQGIGGSGKVVISVQGFSESLVYEY
jgi:hypothetical protein|tara:strand:+ start:669 stop:1103 length:435 start_codon:yes stop_codon:yes gene_type:complete